MFCSTDQAARSSKMGTDDGCRRTLDLGREDSYMPDPAGDGAGTTETKMVKSLDSSDRLGTKCFVN